MRRWRQGRAREDEDDDNLLAKQSPSADDVAARDAGFARWHVAVAGVREHLRTADGHWLLDALSLSAAWSEDNGIDHNHGPVPPVDVLAGVLLILGEAVPEDALSELVAADGALHELRSVNGFIEVGALDGATTAARARIPQLEAILQIEEDAAHFAFREQLTQTLARLGTTGFVTPSAFQALSATRWWPGRSDHPPHRTGSPLGLLHLFRHIEAFHYPTEVHEAADQLHLLSRGTGLPPVEPVPWVLSSLRYLAEHMTPIEPTTPA